MIVRAVVTMGVNKNVLVHAQDSAINLEIVPAVVQEVVQMNALGIVRLLLVAEM